MKSFRSLLVFALVFVAIPSRALFPPGRPVPIPELLKHAGEYLRSNPRDADAFYRIGRIRYIAFAFGATSIPVLADSDDKGIPDMSDIVDSMWQHSIDLARRKEAGRLARREIGVGQLQSLKPEDYDKFGEIEANYFDTLVRNGWIPTNEHPTALLRHAEAAVLAFDEAIRLDSTKPLYHLGRAGILEDFKKRNDAKKTGGLPPVLSKVTHTDILKSYWNAFSLAFVTDGKAETKPTNGVGNFLSYEAGQGYVRVAEAHREKLSEQENARLIEVRNGLKLLTDLPDGGSFITPVIFSFRSVEGMDDLLAPEGVVQFDLRGYGPKQSWTWVKPDTGFLVWDPERSGVIDSGQQMFGSYTWQIFWRDGYEAMSVLDADGNGILEEAELDRLSVWFDRDGNGVSSPGEVVPVKALGIAGLRTQATSKGANHVSNPNGLILQSGQELPTWDWLTSPVTREQPAQSIKP